MSSPKRLVPPGPRADLARAELPLARIATTWFRLSAATHADPLHWSRSGQGRFDSPEAKWGVCYAAESITAAFQEIFGDKIRRSRRLSYRELERLVVWQLDLPPRLRAIALRGETLALLNATTASFVTSYPLSQDWGRALMDHPARLDCLEYIGRRCGVGCLALFGDAAAPKPHQRTLHPRKLGRLSEWKGLWSFLNRIQLLVTELPPKRPPSTWG